MQTQSVKISGLNTCYLETSVEGAIPLLILHGWGSRAERWLDVMDILEEKRIKTIAVDLPGFGESATPEEPWGLEDYEDFVLKFLNNLGIARFNLLGHSFGGRIAIKLAAKNMPGLAKLILVASAGVTPRNNARIFTYKFATKLVKPIFSLPILSALQTIARKMLYKISGSYDYYAQKGVMRETFKNVIAEDLTTDLDKIILPTYIIWGDKDKMTPLSDAYIIHKHIKNSQLTIIENGNHSLNLQMPKMLAEKISNYVIT